MSRKENTSEEDFFFSQGTDHSMYARCTFFFRSMLKGGSVRSRVKSYLKGRIPDESESKALAETIMSYLLEFYRRAAYRYAEPEDREQFEFLAEHIIEISDLEEAMTYFDKAMSEIVSNPGKKTALERYIRSY